MNRLARPGPPSTCYRPLKVVRVLNSLLSSGGTERRSDATDADHRTAPALPPDSPPAESSWPPPSLVAPESNGYRVPLSPSLHDDRFAEPLVQTFRHSGWRRDRERVYDALRQAGEPLSRTHRFARCGDRFHLLQDADDGHHWKFALLTCRDRFCLPCARERYLVIRDNLAAALGTRTTRLLTLTLRNITAPLAAQIDRLLTGFKKLRETSLFRERCTGGAAFLEVKTGSSSTLWHPHLHVIFEGRFIDQRAVSQQWLSITGDSAVVDLRLIRNPHDVPREVAKYATKPLCSAILHAPALLTEAIAALKHRKLLYTFGTWRHYRLLQPADSGHWHLICQDWEITGCLAIPPAWRRLLADRAATLRVQPADLDVTIHLPTTGPPDSA